MNKITPDELMRGNYVLDRGGKVLQIDHWEYHNKISEKREPEYVEYLQPIPITEDWLIKLGFYNDCPSYVIDNDNFTFKMLFHDCWNIMYNEKPGYGSSECIIQCYPYVHELQNLYRALTQQPLTIKK